MSVERTNGRPGSAARQYAALSWRAIVTTARQPAAIVPSLLFPLIFLAMTSAAMSRTIDLPGFPPVDSFLQFLITTTILQGALFGATAAGSDMAKEIENGFFERLVASPVARTSILVGRVAGAAALGFVQALLYLGVGLAFGVDIAGGPAAMLFIALVAAVTAGGIGSLTCAFGIRSGSAEAVQGAFPLIFVLLFFSSAFFPRQLMSGWFETVASANPLSLLIEGLREQVIFGLDAQQLLVSFGVAVGILLLGLGFAATALRARLRRGS